MKRNYELNNVTNAMTEIVFPDYIQEIAPNLRHIAAGMCGDALHFDDLMQAAVIRIIRTYKGESAKILIGRGRSAMMNELVMERRYSAHVADQETLGGPSDPEEDDDVFERFQMAGQMTPEEEMIKREQAQALVDVIATLDPKNQKVVMMLEVGVSQADIARKMGISRAAVSVRVSKISATMKMSFSF